GPFRPRASQVLHDAPRFLNSTNIGLWLERREQPAQDVADRREQAHVLVTIDEQRRMADEIDETLELIAPFQLNFGRVKQPPETPLQEIGQRPKRAVVPDQARNLRSRRKRGIEGQIGMP